MSTRKKVILIVAAGILIALSTCCFSNCAFSDVKIIKSSPVNTSLLKPLADYPGYDLDELKARVESLSTFGRVQDLRGGAWTGDTGRVWQYECGFSGADVNIWIFDNSTNAKYAFDWDAENGSRSGKEKPLLGALSRSAEYAKYPVIQYRDSEVLWIYENQKHLYTSVRLGNMIIDFSETSEDADYIGTDTNEALAQIVKVLLPDAK